MPGSSWGQGEEKEPDGAWRLANENGSKEDGGRGRGIGKGLIVFEKMLARLWALLLLTCFLKPALCTRNGSNKGLSNPSMRKKIHFPSFDHVLRHLVLE